MQADSMIAAELDAQPKQGYVRPEISKQERFLRDKLNLYRAGECLPHDVRRENARACIRCGKADEVIGRHESRDVTYREYFERIYGESL
jgi:hypothetical protein